MKKIIMFFMLLFIPITVKGYGIEDYYINAKLIDNGDLEVEEYYYLNGEYNGTTREILYQNSDLLDFDHNMDYYGGSKIHNASGIEIEKIMAVEQKEDFNFEDIDGDEFDETDMGVKGQYGVYEKSNIVGGIYLKIFIPSKMNKAVYIKYKLKNIAVKHKDVGELFWTIFNSDNSESIHNLKVIVDVKDNSNLRVWAHGPLNGEVKKDNGKLIATINGLSSYRAMDIRATFDSSVIKNSYKKTNVNALNKILNYEEDKANQANYKRKQDLENDFIECENYVTRTCYESLDRSINYINDKKIRSEYELRLEKLHQLLIEKEEENAIRSVELAEYYLSNYYLKSAYQYVDVLENLSLKQDLLKRLDIVYENIINKETKNEVIFSFIFGGISIISIILMIIIYNKCDKEYKTEFNELYYREIPDNYNPILLSYLINKKITNDSISATILNLINKKVILFSKIDNDYILEENKNSDVNLTEIEKRCIKLLFSYKEKIKLKDMKKIAKKNYSSYAANYNAIKSLGKLNGEKLFETKNIKLYKIISIVYFVISFNIGFILLIVRGVADYYINFSLKFALILLVIQLIYMFYLTIISKRTKEAAEDFKKWMALKRFLKDFSKFDDRELQEITLWADYLVYAHVLGISKKLIREMKLKDIVLNNELIINHDYLVLSNTLSHALYSSYSAARSKQQLVSSSNWSSSGGSSSGSSWSSGSGSGGGFSSGGSSGGGGGSVGRF